MALLAGDPPSGPQQKYARRMITADRILVYRLGSLGDTVIALPCFHLIRRTFPSAQITILTNRPVEAKAAPLTSVLGKSGLFDRVFDYPVELRDIRELLRLRNRIRAEKFDLLIHLTAARGLLNSLRDYLFFRWCGIRKILGVPFRRNDLRVRQAGSGRYEWEAQRLARRVRELGQANLDDPESWDLRLTAEERNAADQLLHHAGILPPFIAVSLGTKLLVKDWSTENWKKLLNALGDLHSRLGIVALGAGEERASVDSTLGFWKGTTANFCGQTSPRVSAAILQKAILFVGHDSGPMHLAAAVGTPCVAIFSGHAPRGQWFPRGAANTILVAGKLCPACSGTACRQVEGTCILSIPVEQVFAAVLEKLSFHSPAA